MEDIQELTEKLEKYFLDHLIFVLESESVEVEKAKQITSEFIGLQPFTSFEHMRARMKLFCEIYPLFEPVNKKMFTEASPETKKILNFVEQLMKEKSPSEALKSIGAV